MRSILKDKLLIHYIKCIIFLEVQCLSTCPSIEMSDTNCSAHDLFERQINTLS